MSLAIAATLAAPTIAALLSLTTEGMAALLGWSAAGGAVHAVWLLRRLLSKNEITATLNE